MKTQQEQIEEMCEAIASMICEVYNPQCNEYEPHTCSHCYANDTKIGDFAEMLYNAGYRKPFTSDLASDTQKAFKEGYNKGLDEQKSKIEILKTEIERLERVINDQNELCWSCKKSIKEFARKLKNAFTEYDAEYEYPTLGWDDFCYIINKVLTEYEVENDKS